MPWGDGTGPWWAGGDWICGRGPGWGRRGFGRGWGRGFGRGPGWGRRGYGWGRGYGLGWGFGTDQPVAYQSATNAAPPQPTREEEIQDLKVYADDLKAELDEVRKRLKSLESGK